MKHIIYHQQVADRPEKKGVDCPDGILSAWVAWKAHPDAKIWGWEYNTPEPDFFQPGDEVFIVDFSFAIPVALKWEQQGVKVTLVDHHKTALEAFEEFQRLENQINLDFRFDMAECGCTLAWKEFSPDKPIPLMLQYARERDIWTKRLPQTDVVHNGLSALRKFYSALDEDYHHPAIASHEIVTKFQEDWINILPVVSKAIHTERFQRLFTLFEILSNLDDKVYFEVLAEAGRRAYAERMAIAWKVAGRYQYGVIGGHEIPIVITEKEEDFAYSDICQCMYDGLFPDAPFVALILSDRISVSLRSGKNGINVGGIARKFGGGGQIHAAGFKLPKPTEGWGIT